MPKNIARPKRLSQQLTKDTTSHKSAKLDSKRKGVYHQTPEQLVEDPNKIELPETITVEFVKKVDAVHEVLPKSLTKAERATMRLFPNTRQGKRAARRHIEKARRHLAKQELAKFIQSSE